MKHFILLSASIILSLSSAAVNLPRVYSPDLTVTKDDIGKVISLPFYLEMPAGGNFTNIQMLIQFPSGLHPAMDEYGSYVFEGNDITRINHNSPAVCFSDNFDVEENYPYYDLIGANLSKTPQYTNPNQFVYINVTVDEDYKAGLGCFYAYVKYTQIDDHSLAIGTPENLVPVCNVTFSERPRIKLDQNEAKVEIRREPLQLVASLAGSPLEDNRIIWSSSDESVAIVSSTGLVYGLSYGKVTIKAEMVDGSGYDTCVVETYLDGDMDHNARLDIDDVNKLVNRLLE